MVKAHPETLNYVLELPKSMNIHPLFHTYKLKPYHANDDELLPSCWLSRPEAIIMADGDEEYLIDHILNKWPHG